MKQENKQYTLIFTYEREIVVWNEIHTKAQNWHTALKNCTHKLDCKSVSSCCWDCIDYIPLLWIKITSSNKYNAKPELCQTNNILPLVCSYTPSLMYMAPIVWAIIHWNTSASVQGTRELFMLFWSKVSQGKGTLFNHSKRNRSEFFFFFFNSLENSVHYYL